MQLYRMDFFPSSAHSTENRRAALTLSSEEVRIMWRIQVLTAALRRIHSSLSEPPLAKAGLLTAALSIIAPMTSRRPAVYARQRIADLILADVLLGQNGRISPYFLAKLLKAMREAKASIDVSACPRALRSSRSAAGSGDALVVVDGRLISVDAIHDRILGLLRECPVAVYIWKLSGHPRERLKHHRAAMAAYAGLTAVLGTPDIVSHLTGLTITAPPIDFVKVGGLLSEDNILTTTARQRPFPFASETVAPWSGSCGPL